MKRVEVQPGYESLGGVLDEALEQAQAGKGRERHACGEPFEGQVICEVGRRVGMGYMLGQAVKKVYESKRLSPEAGVRELLGAINYLAAAVIVRRENALADTPVAEQPVSGAKQPLAKLVLRDGEGNEVARMG